MAESAAVRNAMRRFNDALAIAKLQRENAQLRKSTIRWTSVATEAAEADIWAWLERNVQWLDVPRVRTAYKAAMDAQKGGK